MKPNTLNNETPNLVWFGGLMLAIGSIGVVITSLFYALSPIPAALPMPAPNFAEVQKLTLDGQTTLRLAGLVGVPFDIIMLGGALLLMIFRKPAGRPAERLGWAFIAISVFIFIFVDALAVGVLTQLAALDGALAAFAGFKLLFNILFIAGLLAFGMGVPLVLFGELKAQNSVLARPLIILGMASGLGGLAAGLLYFAGLSAPMLGGVCLALGVALFAYYGFKIMQAKNDV